MVQAVEPYVTWLRTTAQQTQQIASSAQTAAAAFSSVRASVVPTAEVTANRMRLIQLLATNGFGRNLPAIAETEAEYQSMWANNSAAMSRYQAASAQASTLPLFASPTSATNPTGLATNASAVPAATTSAATSGATAAQGRAAEFVCADRGFVQLLQQQQCCHRAQCQPLEHNLLVRISHQPAQLFGAESIGPGPAGCEQRRWPRCLGGRAGTRRWGCGGCVRCPRVVD